MTLLFDTYTILLVEVFYKVYNCSHGQERVFRQSRPVALSYSFRESAARRGDPPVTLGRQKRPARPTLCTTPPRNPRKEWDLRVEVRVRLVRQMPASSNVYIRRTPSSPQSARRSWPLDPRPWECGRSPSLGGVCESWGIGQRSGTGSGAAIVGGWA